ncbi:MAG: hypothetical protein K2Q12_10200 [Rickettsiales bacterium]|nr:hypothetical protein [Rickettsiales bacterium]
MVIGILGLVSGGLLTLGTKHTVKTNNTQINERLSRLEDALERYYTKNGTLPCPASFTQAENTAAFGRSTACASATPAGTFRTLPAGGIVANDEVSIGAIPVRTLGLPDSFMYDPWGSRIEYAMIARLSTIPYEAFTTTLTTGVIQVVDATGAQLTPASNLAIVPYAIWSLGSDKRASYNRVGTQNNLGCFSTKDAENCDNDAILMDSELIDSVGIDANYYNDYLKRKLYRKTPLGMIDIESGGVHTCGIMSDRSVRCWGYNSDGQLGVGSTTDQWNPATVTGLNNVRSLGLGYLHSCAVLGDNTVRCWGRNVDGQLGDGSFSQRTSIVTTTGVSNAISVTAGNAHTCIVTNSSNVMCWGSDAYAQLGNIASASSTSPVAVTEDATGTLLTGALAASAGEFHTCALTNAANNNVRCWGSNIFNGGSVNSSFAEVVNFGTEKVLEVSSGDYHACATMTDSSVRCWGRGTEGQLGNSFNGFSNSAIPATPLPVDNLTNVRALYSGGYHTCALLNDRTVHCWGYNPTGQLGNATNLNINYPVQPIGLNNVIDLGGQIFDTCALRSDGVYKCWGWNYFGQHGNGTDVGRTSP